MHDLLLFPGNLQVERDHCLTPVNSSHPDYFLVNKALSELNTEELKARARKNLGINKNISWGDIQGDINNLEDLISYLENNSKDIQSLKTKIETVELNINENTLTINGITVSLSSIDSKIDSLNKKIDNLDTSGLSWVEVQNINN